MGTWTLANFRTELTSLVGGQVTDNARLDLYINTGQDLLVSIAMFEQYIKTVPQNTADADFDYTLATLGIKDIVDTTEASPKRLQFVPPERWSLFIRGTEKGPPRYWSPTEAGFDVWPTPDGIYPLAITHVTPPTPLTTVGQKLAVPGSFDIPCLLLAGHALLGILDEESRSVSLYNRAVSLIGGLSKPEDYNSGRIGAGVRVATEQSDLSRTYLPPVG